MQEIVLNLGTPIDSIVEFGNFIVTGSYCYEKNTGTRSGKIHFLEKKSKKIRKVISTSGTFCLHARDDRLYAANVDDVSILSDNGEILSKIATQHMNMHISIGTYVIISNNAGEVVLRGFDLEVLLTIKLSNDSIWVSREIGEVIFVGTESGNLFSIDLNMLRSKCLNSSQTSSSNILSPSMDIFHTIVKQLGHKREGIIDVVQIGDQIAISSYDDHVQLFCENKLLRSIRTGSLWKIIYFDGKIYCASMYEGMKIFDLQFNLIQTFPTNSICYGLCVTDTEVIWSSFYDNCIYYTLISNK